MSPSPTITPPPAPRRSVGSRPGERPALRFTIHPAPLLALLPALLAGACGATGTDDEPGSDFASRAQAILSGDPTDAYPAVGMIKAAGVTDLCTATLVGRQTILTAAHCVYDYATRSMATAITFTLRGAADARGTTYRGTGAKVHPLYVATDNVTIHDVAVVALDSAPPIAPVTVAVTVPPPLETIEVVGYGVTVPGSAPDGQLRVTRGAVGPLMPTYFDLSATEEGSFCHGDSGGPAFADGAHLLQIGIHSHLNGGTGKNCSGRGREMRVDAYAQWIQEAAAGDVALADVSAKDLIPPPAGTVPEEYPLTCNAAAQPRPAPGLLLVLGLGLLLRGHRRWRALRRAATTGNDYAPHGMPR